MDKFKNQRRDHQEGEFAILALSDDFQAMISIWKSLLLILEFLKVSILLTRIFLLKTALIWKKNNVFISLVTMGIPFPVLPEVLILNLFFYLDIYPAK